MIKNIIAIIINGIFLNFLAQIMMPHVYIQDVVQAILFALVLGILYRFLYPILKWISFPINILTLGLFRIVLNGFIFVLANALMGDQIFFESFSYTMLMAVIYSIFQMIVRQLLRPSHY